MCTAVSYKTQSHYFGRNLDVIGDYGEKVVITPRNYPFEFRYTNPMKTHYALIGMAVVINEYPLYFDATNEKGLSIAGLNFPENAVYYDYCEEKENIAPFELIPYLLGKYQTVKEMKKEINSLNLIRCNFSDALPVTPLHWLISDKEESVTLECTKDGMKLHENPFGVLTNNPVFDFHMLNMNRYMSLHEGGAENRFRTGMALKNDSLGYGAFGLPGDFSSSSRFVKTVFVKEKSVCGGSEKESVSQFFHILQAVAMPKGCVLTPEGAYEYTSYSSCCNTDTQVYYHTTYDNPSIQKTDLHSVNLEEEHLL